MWAPRLDDGYETTLSSGDGREIVSLCPALGVVYH